MPVNPSEIKLFEFLEKRAEANPSKPLEQQTIAEFRAGNEVFLEFTGKPTNISYEEQFVSARDGHKIPIGIYNNDIKTNTPVLIMYPGCGYILDLFEINAIACSRIAKYSGIKVILVNFRLAPEHPLPIAIYDGYDATKYIATHAEQYRIDPDKIFIGGISSGAHCAAVISNLARADNELNIHHQILINGAFDLTLSNHEYDAYEKEDKMCNREATAFIYKHWGIKPEQFKNPLFSPYYEKDLSNLPPTSFIIAEYDGLRNDSEAYYKKVKATGNQVEKIILPGQTHNTMVMRDAMSDGEDPAKVIANVVARNLNFSCHPESSEGSPKIDTCTK